MSEVIKRFNKETGQWEVVAAGNANNIITSIIINSYNRKARF